MEMVEEIRGRPTAAAVPEKDRKVEARTNPGAETEADDDTNASESQGWVQQRIGAAEKPSNWDRVSRSFFLTCMSLLTYMSLPHQCRRSPKANRLLRWTTWARTLGPCFMSHRRRHFQQVHLFFTVLCQMRQDSSLCSVSVPPRLSLMPPNIRGSLLDNSFGEA